MNKHLGFYALLIIITVQLYSQEGLVNDGPYIFIEDDHLISRQVVRGEVNSEVLGIGSFDTTYIPEKSIYQNVSKIVALSDIHGQYELAVEILQNNKIIDSDLNWNFGSGHMVIVGDIFDRGPKVTEVLWLIYKLERQAKAAGGFVHFLLGNHEYMVLRKDLRYLHEKYERVAELLEMDYDQMFNNRTILGRWLRSKPTIVKLNEHVFVHGGISNGFLSKVGFDIEKINLTMRQSIDRSKEEMTASGFYGTYYGSSGPIWYRGYFYGKLSDQSIDSVLNQTNSEHVVVGHCSNDHVVSLFDNKIFGVDSSIKKGQYGEVLFLNANGFFRGTKSGEKLKFE